MQEPGTVEQQHLPSLPRDLGGVPAQPALRSRLVVAWNGRNVIDPGQSVGVASDAGAVAMQILSKQEGQLAEATSTSTIFGFLWLVA